MRQLSRHSSDQPYPHLNVFLLSLPCRFCRPHPGAVHLLGPPPPAYTYAALKVLVAGGRAELSCRDAGTQTPTLPHAAE